MDQNSISYLLSNLSERMSDVLSMLENDKLSLLPYLEDLLIRSVIINDNRCTHIIKYLWNHQRYSQNQIESILHVCIYAIYEKINVNLKIDTQEIIFDVLLDTILEENSKKVYFNEAPGSIMNSKDREMLLYCMEHLWIKNEFYSNKERFVSIYEKIIRNSQFVDDILIDKYSPKEVHLNLLFTYPGKYNIKNYLNLLNSDNVHDMLFDWNNNRVKDGQSRILYLCDILINYKDLLQDNIIEWRCAYVLVYIAYNNAYLVNTVYEILSLYKPELSLNNALDIVKLMDRCHNRRYTTFKKIRDLCCDLCYEYDAKILEQTY